MNITVTITGDSDVMAKLDKFKSVVLNMSDDLKDIGGYLTQYYSVAPFKTNGSVYGSNWPPLKPATLAAKAKADYAGAPTLILTGTMSRSFKASFDSESVTISNSVDYFKYHQSTLPRRTLPRRQMMGFNTEVMKNVVSIISTGIQNRIKQL